MQISDRRPYTEITMGWCAEILLNTADAGLLPASSTPIPVSVEHQTVDGRNTCDMATGEAPDDS